MNVWLPYREFVFMNGDTPAAGVLWDEVCNLSRQIIERVTGNTTVHHLPDRITCRYYMGYQYDLQNMVADGVYRYLISKGIPVIHNGGDVAGFGPDNDSMEDGTKDSIFQYQSCSEYQAPDWVSEIFSAMQLPKYNRFVAFTEAHCIRGNVAVWGKITAYDRPVSIITITPLNPKYEPVTLHFVEIARLLRVVSHSYWQCTENTDALQAAKSRAALIGGIS